MSVPPMRSSGPERGPEPLAICPLCETAYQPMAPNVLAARDDAHLLYLECRRCGTGAVALVTNGPVGLHAVGTMTDLLPHEVLSIPDRSPVNDDDVIAIVETLRQDDHLLPTIRRS